MSQHRVTTPHRRARRGVPSVMAQVLYALVPAILVHAWLFGWGIFIQLALAIGFALGFEGLMLRLRQRPVSVHLKDLSAVVAAVLFALSIPPLAPWWVAFVGMLFAIVIAKQLYGGIGFNLFNPAMVGFAAVIIAFPLALTQWVSPRTLVQTVPDWHTTWTAIFKGQWPFNNTTDAISQATPLDRLRSGLLDGQTLSEIQADPLFGAFGSSGWEWLALAYLLGGLYLIQQRIITWHVPLAVLFGTLVLTLPGWLIDPDLFRSPLQQLAAGSLVMCAFFIATDPVSGSSTPRGKIVFSIGVVVLTLAIRAWGGFPDGVAFAVLLMNMFVPLIDRYTTPRIFGHPTSKQLNTEQANKP
ncbi:MAG TPA: RnfABCDGE type electron transport complex subunit D [Wenzhouxiangella sp.]